MQLVDEIEVLIDKTGEVCFQGELLRLRADLSGRGGDIAGAQSLLEQALRLTEDQGALSVGLRVATSMASLLRDQGEPQRAAALLSPIVDRFGPGCQVPDLIAARATLSQT